MSPADSVIVFILAIVVIYVVLFVATAHSNARHQAKLSKSMPSVNIDDAAIAKRLSSSASNVSAREPRGVDIGERKYS